MTKIHTLKLLIAILSVVVLGLLAQQIFAGSSEATQKNDSLARQAFLAALPVLKHPRCLNCHSTGDFPRQGDDGHAHAQNVRRGIDGKGKYGQKCTACHQEQNVAGLNMPPGAPNWHLPTGEMPMIGAGRTPNQICRQLKDQKEQRKTVAQIVEHVSEDKLVCGLELGDGRTPPPLSHADFEQSSRTGPAMEPPAPSNHFR